MISMIMIQFVPSACTTAALRLVISTLEGIKRALVEVLGEERGGAVRFTYVHVLFNARIRACKLGLG